MTDIIINLQSFPDVVLYARNLPALLSLKVKSSKHLCVKQIFRGGAQVRENCGRKTWGDRHCFQSRSLPPPALTIHFQRKAHWKQSCMILNSKFNSVCKVKEVSGQSAAHLNWAATCCFNTQPAPKNTERYCSLLTAVGHWGWNADLLSKFICEYTLKWPVLLFCFTQSFLHYHFPSKKVSELCRGHDHILACITRDVIPQRIEQGLFMIRYTSLSPQ